jgi:hypothetical protein
MMAPKWTTWLGAMLISATLAACSAWAADANSLVPAKPLPVVQYGKGRLLCLLANKKITESSGIAASRRTAGVFWTHNDSGDKPNLYAFDLRGRDLGTWQIQGIASRDWEDMASFSLGGKPWLLVADTGDNDQKCKTPMLHVIPEPRADPNRPVASPQNPRAGGQVGAAMTIAFLYDDGCQDCEAVGVDATSRTILLISKRGKRTVYELPLPQKSPARPLTAKSIATLDLGMVTAMDISPDGLRAVVATYGDLTEYARGPGESWAVAFGRPGRTIAAPGRQQGESVCYGPDGKTLYLTSEGSPCPLLTVPVAGSR